MRVTIDLEQELWQEAKKRAGLQQTSLDHVVSHLLRLGLAVESGTPNTGRFTFRLPGGVVTTGEVNASLEEDDE